MAYLTIIYYLITAGSVKLVQYVSYRIAGDFTPSTHRATPLKKSPVLDTGSRSSVQLQYSSVGKRTSTDVYDWKVRTLHSRSLTRAFRRPFLLRQR